MPKNTPVVVAGVGGGLAPDRHLGRGNVFFDDSIFGRVFVFSGRARSEQNPKNGVIKNFHTSQAAFLMRKHAPSAEVGDLRIDVGLSREIEGGSRQLCDRDRAPLARN